MCSFEWNNPLCHFFRSSLFAFLLVLMVGGILQVYHYYYTHADLLNALSRLTFAHCGRCLFNHCMQWLHSLHTLSIMPIFLMSHCVHWHLSPSLHMLTHWIMPVLYNHHHPTPSLSLSLQLFFWSQTLEFVLSIGGALLFCGFIIFDTHIIMHKLSTEEYILASINLYLDFINLFIYILRILQAARKDWYCLNACTHTHTNNSLQTSLVHIRVAFQLIESFITFFMW